jgi:hypothetical protein
MHDPRIPDPHDREFASWAIYLAVLMILMAGFAFKMAGALV